MKRTVIGSLLVLALTAAPAAAQWQSPITANIMIPRVSRTAPLADWTPGPNRSQLTLPVEGGTLRGYLYRGNDPSLHLTVLFFNGNGGTLDRAQFPVNLAAQGPDVAAYDYRGFGFSSGTPDVITFRADALKAFDATAAAAGGPSHVVVVGYSFGTSFAAYVASQRPVRGLVLISSIATIQRQAISYNTMHGRMSLQQAQALTYTDEAREVYDNVGMVAKSTAPLVVIHGSDDDVVSPDQGRDVYAASPAKSKHLILLPPGAKHNAPGQPNSMAAMHALFEEVRN